MDEREEVRRENAEHEGDVQRLLWEKEAEDRGVQKERERCAAVVQMARHAEIDQDFRAIIHIIEGGMTIDQVKEFCATTKR